jgi:signal transduction histidine kinase/CheY-like chemotaxis protein
MPVRPSLDLSISHRLWIGFGLVFALLLMLAAVLAGRLQANNEAQIEFTDRVLERSNHAGEIERSVLYVGLRVRDAALNPTDATRQQFWQSETRLGEAMKRFVNLQLDDRARAGFGLVQELAQQYVLESRRAVDGAGEPPAALREKTLEAIHALVRYEEQEAAAALARMADNRQAAMTAISAGTLLTGLLLLLIGHMTVRSVRRPAQRLVEVAASLKGGHWKAALALRTDHRDAAPPRDEMLQIGQAFRAAAGGLELREQRLAAHRDIASASASSLDKGKISAASLRLILQEAGADVGALYVLDSSGMLIPIATRALETQLETLALGEGIVGEAARDAKPVILRDIPPEASLRVRLGYDEALARTAAAIPVRFGDETLGVLLVASVRELAADGESFLAAAASQLAIGLKNARAYEEIERLLLDLREKSERIQAQNEEIQAQSEELQAQNEEIQAQSEEIQAQNEDLKRQSESLLEHTRILEETDVRKNEFLGMLAHELRNPLAPMSNCLHLLQKARPGTPEFGKAQEVLGRQMRHLTHLVDDLLDITRISRGKITVTRERLNLVQLIHHCLEDHRNAIDEHRLALTLDLPDTPIEIDADYTRLCQVFSNLLTNAVKFTRPGSGIVVRAALHPEQREVAVHIVDDGMGIEPALLPRLFQPFIQGDSGLARSKGGLGLGLALAKGLVELHGGRIEARSPGPERGAEFVVMLPVAGTDIGADSAGALASVRPLRTRAGSLAARILVIDDSIDAAQSLAALLRLEGCQVDVAYTGEAGYEQLNDGSPDAILCDIGLPGLDGYEFARRVRANPRFAGTLLIAITGYGSTPDQEQARAAGFDTHIAKPPDIDTLLELLHDAVARKGADRSGLTS